MVLIRTKRCKCKSCEKIRDYSYDTNEGRCPEDFKCACGGTTEWWFQPKQNRIHTEISSLYDQKRRDGFGGVDPRFGVAVTSYQEKKALLKERGMEETDVERFDDIQNDVATKEAAQAATSERNPNMLVADSVEEVMSKISNDQIDRGATGSLVGRKDQDPDSGLIDGWNGF